MGYTHYMRYENDIGNWDNICDDVLKILAEYDGALGTTHIGRDDSFDDDFIRIDGPEGNTSENLVVGRCAEKFKSEYRQDEPEVFIFCKTTRLPYDEVIVASLLAFKYHNPENVRLSSDGWPEDWEQGAELFRQATDNELPDNTPVLQEDNNE